MTRLWELRGGVVDARVSRRGRHYVGREGEGEVSDGKGLTAWFGRAGECGESSRPGACRDGDGESLPTGV